jgi:hypothetical protein
MTEKRKLKKKLEKMLVTPGSRVTFSVVSQRGSGTFVRLGIWSTTRGLVLTGDGFAFCTREDVNAELLDPKRGIEIATGKAALELAEKMIKLGYDVVNTVDAEEVISCQ